LYKQKYPGRDYIQYSYEFINSIAWICVIVAGVRVIFLAGKAIIFMMRER